MCDEPQPMCPASLWHDDCEECEDLLNPDKFEFLRINGIDFLYLQARLLFVSALKGYLLVEGKGNYRALLKEFISRLTNGSTEEIRLIANAEFLLLHNRRFEEMEELVLFKKPTPPLSVKTLGKIVSKMASIALFFGIQSLAEDLDTILYKLHGDPLQLLAGFPVIVNQKNWSKDKITRNRQQVLSRLARIFAHDVPAEGQYGSDSGQRNNP